MYKFYFFYYSKSTLEKYLICIINLLKKFGSFRFSCLNKAGTLFQNSIYFNNKISYNFPYYLNFFNCINYLLLCIFLELYH